MKSHFSGSGLRSVGTWEDPILSSIGLIRPIFGVTPTANLLVKIGMYVHIQNFLTFKGTPFNSTHKSPKASQSGAGSFPKAARAEDKRESCGDRCFLTSPLPFLPFFFFFVFARKYFACMATSGSLGPVYYKAPWRLGWWDRVCETPE